MNKDIHDNTICFYTDMWLFSFDDDNDEEMQLTKEKVFDILSNYFSNEEISKLIQWATHDFLEVNSDYDEENHYESNLLYWLMLSWFSEMSLYRHFDISDYMKTIVGRPLIACELAGIIESSLKYYDVIRFRFEKMIEEERERVMSYL